MKHLSKTDRQIHKEISNELTRQQNGLIMIPSENFTAPAVLEAMASVLSNKYSEGYPNARYYTGNEHVDEIEELAIKRVKKLFNAEHANVQPHSGTTANLAAYLALLNPGDKILSMDLSHGGHLSHGSKASIVSKMFNIIHYGVEHTNNQINYNRLRQIALQEKPQLIVSGTSSYPRQIDFEEITKIAREIRALHLADISHIAGLILAGVHPDPVPFADVVTTTTHKTLRGPRSAIILSKEKHARKIDKAVFPGTQGGPLEHVIAAKAVCFNLASKDQFIKDQKQTVNNAKALEDVFNRNGIKMVTNGTDTHLILIDLRPLDIKGKDAANLLESCGIYTNFNVIPFDDQSPNNPSGLRLGTPALTTQGMKEEQMEQIGQVISDILKNPKTEKYQKEAKKLVKELTQQFPIYAD